MAAIFENFFKSGYSVHWGSKISTNSLDLQQLRRKKQSCVFALFRKFKMAIFSKVGVVYSLDTLGVENFDEITLCLTVKEVEAILCFATLGL